MENDIIDINTLNMLEEILQGGTKELLEKYIILSTELMVRIDEGIKNSDSEAIIQAAHSLKSSSAQIGALKLSELFIKLESAGKENDLVNTAEIFSEVRDMHKKVTILLKQRIT